MIADPQRRVTTGLCPNGNPGKIRGEILVSRAYLWQMKSELQ